MKKVIAAIVMALLITYGNANAQETMKFDTESKKFIFIRQMLSKEKHLRPADGSTRFCAQMMKDLLANSNFKAIEPDVRADSVDDPKLGIWRQCDDREYTDFDIDPKTFYGGLEQLGAPPYRYYRIELDNNPKNGPEDLIYHEHIVEHPSNTLTGYTWVNLKKCEIMDNFIVEGSANWSEKPDAAYLNTLVYYKRKLWILDFVDGFDLHLSRRIDRSSMDICRWRLYLPN